MKAVTRKKLVITIIALLAAALYFVAVFPTSQLISTYREIQGQSRELAYRQHQLIKLKHQISMLHNPKYIAEIARDEYGMYPKGSVPYQILPSSPLYSPNSSNSSHKQQNSLQ